MYYGKEKEEWDKFFHLTLYLPIIWIYNLVHRKYIPFFFKNDQLQRK